MQHISILVGLISALALTASPAAAAPVPHKPAALQDRAFVADAIQGDLSMIKLGKFAEKKAGSDAMRSFARTLVQDHGKALQQAKDVAKQINARVPKKPLAGAAKEERKLFYVEGKAFDAAFAGFMVKEHKKDIKAFEKEAKRSGPAASLAQQQLPTLKKHLRLAQSLPVEKKKSTHN